MAALLCGMLYAGEDRYMSARQRLIESFGNIIEETGPRDWDHSEYYKKELGDGIKRRFIFFDTLVAQDRLKDIKLNTIEIEKQLSLPDGRRTVNIDPGLLTDYKLVLATTKNYSHRIYLGDGIFAEATLSYVGNSFVPHMFTYTDYKSEEAIALFGKMREVYKKLSAKLP